MIYLDHSATTYVDLEVKKEMDRYFSQEFGNPGSMHQAGLTAKEAVKNAREKIAQILNCQPQEIIFTSGGTESVNLAIQGLAKEKKQGHIITTKTEHHAVLETCKALEKQGFEVTYLDVDKFGMVNPGDVGKNIKPNTILVSIIYANNEIGTINNIKEISKITKKHNIPLHTDACQAGLLDLNVGADLVTLNGSKIYGPKGIGILYKNKNIKLQPIIYGGGQEFNLRSGTENVPGIVGFARALELIQKNKEQESKRLIQLRDKLIENIKKIPKAILNGHPTERHPGNVNFSFADIEGESIVLHLNEQGICASTGSACTSNDLEPSHVLIAAGQPAEIAHGSIRFTLGKQTTEKDIEEVIEKLPKIIESLRKISPVQLEIKNEIKT
ncbi:cysteine desulfurase [Candidatus Woesearchaeota archaeon]|nr:cysteine desulfurase [Candidatus Woesearchaeota archaeon]